MKKIIASIAALLTLTAANALNVTYQNVQVQEGQVITLKPENFEHIEIPGILNRWEARADFAVASPVTLYAEAPNDVIQICGAGSCYTSTKSGDVYVYNQTNVGNFDVETSFSNVDVLPEEVSTVKVKLSSGSDVLNFSVVFDTRVAGVSGIDADSDYVVAGDNQIVYSLSAPATVEVYSLGGAALISAEVDGEGAVDLSTLPAGVYLYRAGAVTGKIAVK